MLKVLILVTVYFHTFLETFFAFTVTNLFLKEEKRMLFKIDLYCVRLQDRSSSQTQANAACFLFLNHHLGCVIRTGDHLGRGQSGGGCRSTPSEGAALWAVWKLQWSKTGRHSRWRWPD